MMFADPLVMEDGEPCLLQELTYVDEYLNMKNTLSCNEKEFHLKVGVLSRERLQRAINR